MSTFVNIGRDQVNIQVNPHLPAAEQILQKLNPAPMDFSSRSECLQGTRMDIIESIVDWVNLSAEEKVLWLRGLPGSGKSTLCTTIASRLQVQEHLAAYLFFHRTGSQPSSVIRTLAHQLGSYDTRIATAIADVVDRTPHICQSPLRFQFLKLIVEPLSNLPMTETPMVLVLDALDECGTANDRKILLSILAEETIHLPPFIRILITSRAEYDIMRALEGHSHIAVRELSLSSDTNVKDILLFLRSKMAEIRLNNPGLRLPLDWPGDVIIQALADRAAGLFIWAYTACRFVDGHDPRKRLDVLLQGNVSVNAESALDALYSTALESAGRWDDEDFCIDFRAIMGTILVTRQPLSHNAIDNLLCLDRPSLHTLSRLGCVLDLNDGDMVRILHPSFRDFLSDNERCKEFWFLDLTRSNRHLAIRCMERLENVLRRNIYQSELSLTAATEILSEDVSYACSFWIDHVCWITTETTLIEVCVEKLCQRFLLEWLESMSYLRISRVATGLLNRLLKWLTIYTRDREALLRLVYDAYRFAEAFAESIGRHPLLIYASALAFAPTSSSVYKNFHDRESMPSVAGGYQPSWTSLLPHESSNNALPCSLALSANGTTIAFGHSDHTIRIWDVASGDEVHTLPQGHSDSVWALAFSADGRRIFSGSSDETVHLWDAVHGAEICTPLHGHGVTILSVGFYPDESRIITGCADRTIHVYDAASHREVLTPLRGHDGPVESVAVSPDGLQIVSGSRDKTVRLWDAITGTELLPPLQGHRDWVLAAIFASNGTCIISGSEDGTLRIWNSSTGAIIDVIRLRLPHKRAITKIALSCDGTRAVYGLTDGNIYVFDMTSRKSDMLTLHGGHQGRFHIVHAVVLSPYVSPLVSAPHRQSRLATLHEERIRTIAFSSDGTRIATGSDDHNVSIWDAVTGQSAQKLLRGHKEEVVSLMFSPDGTRVISGSFDFTCRVWDVFSGTEVFEQLLGHTGVVWAVAFSPDGSRMASGSTDTTVRVWDAKTGIQSLPPLEGAAGSIRALAFSHDGGRIAVCSWEGNICIWGAATGVKVLKLVRNGIAKEPAGPFRWSVEFSLDGLRIISNARDNYCTWDTTTGNQLLDNAEYPFGELCNANHPIVITSGCWIIDLRTQRVLSRVPDIVGVQCYKGSKSSMALATVNGLVVMHFPHLMLAH